MSHLCLYKYPSPEPLKLDLVVEAKAWKTAYGHGLNARYRTSMENIVQFVTEYSKCLARPIKVRIQLLHTFMYLIKVVWMAFILSVRVK